MRTIIKLLGTIIIMLLFLNNSNAQKTGWIKEEGRSCFISENEEKRIWFDNEINFNEYGVGIAEKNDKLAFVNSSGQIVSDWFDYISSYTDGVASVIKRNEKYENAYVNKKGEIISDWYKNIDTFSDGLGRVILENGEYSYVDTTGKLIFSEDHSLERYFGDLLLVHKPFVKKHPNNTAIIDKKGVLKTDWFFSIECHISDRHVQIGPYKISNYINEGDDTTPHFKRKFGFMDQNFEIISNCQFDDASYFNKKNLAIITKDNKSACINISGIQQGNWYDEINIDDLNNDIKRVRQNGKYGYIDENCELIIPPQYDYAEEFMEVSSASDYEGMQNTNNSPTNNQKDKMIAKVKKDGDEFFINTKGVCVKWCP